MRTGVVWWLLKATERLPWLSPEVFWGLAREEQILLLVYAHERDQEEFEHAVANVLPLPM